MHNYNIALKRKARKMRAKQDENENDFVDIDDAFRCLPPLNEVNGMNDLDANGNGSNTVAMNNSDDNNNDNNKNIDEHPIGNGVTASTIISDEDIFKVQDIFDVESAMHVHHGQMSVLTSKLEIDDSEMESPPQQHTSPQSDSPSYAPSNGERAESMRVRDDPALLLTEIFRDIVDHASKEVHPMKKLYDYFSDCVVALPDDLQRDCNKRIMLMITEYEETASYRRTQID